MGLTLKRYDEHKERYWLSDYRFLSRPELCKKEIILPQLQILVSDEKDKIAKVATMMKVPSGTQFVKLDKKCRELLLLLK